MVHTLLRFSMLEIRLRVLIFFSFVPFPDYLRDQSQRDLQVPFQRVPRIAACDLDMNLVKIYLSHPRILCYGNAESVISKGLNQEDLRSQIDINGFVLLGFAEGVCYAKKDFNLAKHPLIESVPNLQVIKLMQSFKSKEYVRETFAWMHYYWFLTNEGIEFLRTYLNLPSDVVPATLKKSAKPIGRPFGGPPGDRSRGPPRFEGDRPRFGDRDGYRGGPRGGDVGGEKGGAPADFQPSFQGSGGRPGFGRGAGGYSAAAPSGSGFP
ncbi:unnamed protein product [Arabis nemorensis]|uniref:Plectin/eS10 N-terminal domain-containing protein n=1 Tax=Arabis nemorensis TaxID=586526 RepID=A0A565ATD8_9BRAS|nr:unnamed protein product [Arabis nemorensis]